MSDLPVTVPPGARPRPAGGLVTMALAAAAFVYAVWYAVGFVIFTTEWFGMAWRARVTGWGDCVFLSLAGLVTILLLRRDFSWKVVIPSALLVLVGSGTAEIIGVRTGYPFGDYMYTGRLGGLILDMPWIIPVCWLILVINLYLVCAVLVVPSEGEVPGDAHLLLILITAVAVTLVDLNLEPAAVNVKQYWLWLDRDRAYYGVPRLNFFGWFVVTTILVSGLSHLIPPRRCRISTAWGALALLASIQLFFAVINWQAQQYAPVLVALNLVGILAIGLAWLSGK